MDTNLVCCGRSTTTWQLGRPAARSWRTTAGHPAARTTTAWLICSAHDHRPPSFTLSRGVEIPPRSRLLIIRFGTRTTSVVPSCEPPPPPAGTTNHTQIWKPIRVRLCSDGCQQYHYNNIIII